MKNKTKQKTMESGFLPLAGRKDVPAVAGPLSGNNYLMCFSADCPRHSTCLRWIAGLNADPGCLLVNCINPRSREVAAGTCNRYRNAEPVRMPCGMTRFYDDMPKKIAMKVRPLIEKACLHTNYYLYRKGVRPVPPHVEERIRCICRDCGWDGPLAFDGYVTGYLW